MLREVAERGTWKRENENEKKNYEAFGPWKKSVPNFIHHVSFLRDKVQADLCNDHSSKQ